MDVSRSDESAEPAEVYEHIPWAELTVPPHENKRWVVYLAAGAVAVASLGALAARSIGANPIPPPAVVPPMPAPVVTALPAPPLPEEQVLSEADLLAVTPGADEVGAAARAEWFVTDFFSSGGDPGASQAVLDALPAGSRLPEAAESASTSYVEWVTTSRLEALGSGRFRCTVLYRMLVSTGEGGYVRLPVRAVDVIVEVENGGGTRVVDLPMPVEFPAAPSLATWDEPVEELPNLIREAALHRAGMWGDEPTVIEGSEREGGWRVVVSVVDGAGVRWPLTLWLSDQGESVWPTGAGG